MTGILVNSIPSHIKELATIFYSFKRCNHSCTVFSMRKAWGKKVSKFIKILGSEYLKFKIFYFSFLLLLLFQWYSKTKIVIVWKYIWQTRLMINVWNSRYLSLFQLSSTISLWSSYLSWVALINTSNLSSSTFPMCISNKGMSFAPFRNKKQAQRDKAILAKSLRKNEARALVLYTTMLFFF